MKKVVILSCLMMLTGGCATSGLHKMELVPVSSINKPTTIKAVNIRMAAVTHADYHEVQHVSIDEISMINIFNKSGLYNKKESKYLAHVISPLTRKWKEPVYARIFKKDSPIVIFGFGHSDEWGNVFFIQYKDSRGHEKSNAVSSTFSFLVDPSYVGYDSIEVNKKFDLAGTMVDSRVIPLDISRIQGFGFTNSGKELDKGKISKIKDNTWTIDQVRSLLGVPNEERLLQDGSRVYTYFFQSFGKSKAHILNPFNIFVQDKIRHTQVLELRASDDVILEHNFTECDSGECENVL